MPYDPTTKIVTAPLSLWDVEQATDTYTPDVGAVCSSSGINKWARYKPYAYPSNFADITPTTLRLIGYDSANGMPTVNSDYFIYDKPIGTASSPYRLGDFRLYKKNAVNLTPHFNVDSEIYVNSGEDISIQAIVPYTSSSEYQITWDNIIGTIGSSTLSNPGDYNYWIAAYFAEGTQQGELAFEANVGYSPKALASGAMSTITVTISESEYSSTYYDKLYLFLYIKKQKPLDEYWLLPVTYCITTIFPTGNITITEPAEGTYTCVWTNYNTIIITDYRITATNTNFTDIPIRYYLHVDYNVREESTLYTTVTCPKQIKTSPGVLTTRITTTYSMISSAADTPEVYIGYSVYKDSQWSSELYLTNMSVTKG